MLVVISPAKRLNWDVERGAVSTPDFHAEANRLAGHARQLTLAQLKGLMGLSDDLARLNRDRFRAFEPEPTEDNSKPAALAFAGDTYMGLDAASLDPEDMEWARDHLRILSGLYGVLRPRDAIQAYRLEMGSRLKTRRGQTLYDFWGDTIARALNAQAAETGSDSLVNCASQEYFGAVDLKRLTPRVVTPQFMELKDGKAKIVSFFAKKARGAMARYIVQNRLTDPQDILGFDTGGYAHALEMSEPDRPVFLRDYPAT
ncbi:peroxide stress protein YaaA [Oceaniglobus trochenteri]|uniref:peroxide stress protein YaaA n=1 Tax=Oceaniglobus trochenteri TaxID=2763260 RepID=UPI001CFF7CC3|nr:peroxide stress protein YaaA [Oceaniglobus trochenteri]